MSVAHDLPAGARERADALRRALGAMGRVLVAFSGGVDSTFLLRAALDALGAENVLAVTLDPPYAARSEIGEAVRLAASLGASRHTLVDVPFPEALRDNPPERCYLCKRLLFARLLEIAAAADVAHVLDGTNRDDLGDHRPGRKALAELGIVSPLLDAGLAKADIRALSREWRLPTWDKPAAPCLLTRLPHGASVDAAVLARIEQGEALLRELGFPGARLRLHGDLARIEAPAARLGELVAAAAASGLAERLGRLGCRFVTVDLAGYRMGSQNEPATGGDKTDSRAMDTQENLFALLTAVKNGELDVAAGMERLRDLPYLEMGHTKIDLHRPLRNGFPEVVYAAGKTAGQVVEIFIRLRDRGPVLATRVPEETASRVLAACPEARHNPLGRTLTMGEDQVVFGEGEIGVVTAGTSDLPVAEEALETCRMFGHRAFLVSDVGVAGLHRLLDRIDLLRRARALIVIAGMEGALASVVGGLVAQPVVAVPTSVGYGAALSGFTALCGMLTSCASGVTVVNIDNGFGAACAACRINTLCRQGQDA